MSKKCIFCEGQQGMVYGCLCVYVMQEYGLLIVARNRTTRRQEQMTVTGAYTLFGITVSASAKNGYIACMYCSIRAIMCSVSVEWLPVETIARDGNCQFLPQNIQRTFH
jgi:hypothetical protein